MRLDVPNPTRPGSRNHAVDAAPAVLASSSKAFPETVIEARSGWQFIDWTELWKYRDLAFFLVWRDVKVRYKQTVLGAAWAVLQPMLMMVVFTLFLGKLAQVPDGPVPYPVFVYAGLLPWTLFATAIGSAGNSVVDSERLITKVYFPRLAIPFAAAGAALVDFAIALSFLLILIIANGIALSWQVILAPLVILIMMGASFGVGALLAALNVAYRDFRYVIPFMIQLWLFATPSVYMQASLDSIPDGGLGLPRGLGAILSLNPMIGLIAFFRATVLGGPLPWADLGCSTVIVALFFGVGCYYFRRVEGSFADII
jgi:lipopolysaccharide transport system permease protein